MKKRIVSVLLCAAMVAAMAAGCGQQESGSDSTDSGGDEDKIVIGWTDANLSNESNALCADAAIARADELGVELIVNDGEGTSDKQISQCESFVAQGVDVVIISPYDYDACVTAAQVCVDAGIPVFVAKGTIANMDIVDFCIRRVL